MTNFSAKPIRRGDIYCARWCGGNCTWAAYQLAKERAAKLCKRMGDGWKPRVWENLGWHYMVFSACTRLRVCPSHHGNRISYSAFIGDTDGVCAGGRWVEHGKTPQSAIKKVIAKAKADLAQIGAMIEGL